MCEKKSTGDKEYASKCYDATSIDHQENLKLP